VHHADVVDVLVADHRDLVALLDRVVAAGPGPVRTDLLRTAADRLRRHAVAEERHLHPVLRRLLDDPDRCVQADVEEHEQLERLLVELEAAGPDGPGTDELLRGLACATRRHVEGVQRWRLLVLRRRLTGTELAELADRTREILRAGSPQPT
jgi:hypothetical protein